MFAVLFNKTGADVIQVAYGSQQRSGHVSTATLHWWRRGANITAMRMVYLMFDLGENRVEVESLSIEELQSISKAHCLLLPYVLSNIAFAKQFPVVYDDWDAEKMNEKQI